MSAPEYSQRLVFGGLFASGALLLAHCLLFFWGLGLLAAVLLVILQIAVGEFGHLVHRLGAEQTPRAAPVFIGGLFTAACEGFGWEHWHFIAPLFYLGLYAGFLLFCAHAMRNSDRSLLNIAALVLGGLYLALPLAALYKLISDCGADYQLRQWWAVYAVAVTKMTDIGAWFFGKLWGRSPLGLLSPHKTVEGIWGGLLIGCLTGIALCQLHPRQELNWQTLCSWSLLHLCVSGVAQGGDLLESLLKRAVKARHSGSLPGLGGVLDLLDSLLLTAPLLYLWCSA